jgi:hypothetical protein
MFVSPVVTLVHADGAEGVMDYTSSTLKSIQCTCDCNSLQLLAWPTELKVPRYGDGE